MVLVAIWSQLCGSVLWRKNYVFIYEIFNLTNAAPRLRTSCMEYSSNKYVWTCESQQSQQSTHSSNLQDYRTAQCLTYQQCQWTGWYHLVVTHVVYGETSVYVWRIVTHVLWWTLGLYVKECGTCFMVNTQSICEGMWHIILMVNPQSICEGMWHMLLMMNPQSICKGMWHMLLMMNPQSICKGMWHMLLMVNPQSIYLNGMWHMLLMLNPQSIYKGMWHMFYGEPSVYLWRNVVHVLWWIFSLCVKEFHSVYVWVTESIRGQPGINMCIGGWLSQSDVNLG